MPKPKVIAIVGPTASGKTALSIEIAKRFGGEVVSADSRQVYRGMNLGSGKVTPEEMDSIPHHLLDVADPMTVYTSADFKRDAEAALRNIIARNKLPVVAGGSFFYMELLRGKMTAAPVEPNYVFREQLEQYSDAELLEQLRASDPRRAETIDPQNRRRLIRALEIIDALGAVPEPHPVNSPYDWLVLGIDMPQAQLHERIRARILERLAAGMLEEARHLHANGVTWERMDELGLEYRYMAAHLTGQLTYEEMVEQLDVRTRQFAKRQLTWLKRDTDIIWLQPGDLRTAFDTTANFLR
jgi:tRNA dimethylallyltransferase